MLIMFLIFYVCEEALLNEWEIWEECSWSEEGDEGLNMPCEYTLVIRVGTDGQIVLNNKMYKYFEFQELGLNFDSLCWFGVRQIT